MLLLGIPGCGKSLLCKTIAREWKLPLMKLDMGKVFGSLVGQSEGQIRAAIEAAEACSPCVLWVDEIEKGLAGSGGGGGEDSGTGQRVFGTLLTWLEEIFKIQLKRRDRSMKPAQVKMLAGKSEGFSGAEIEQAIVSGLFAAFADGARILSTGDVLDELANTTPLSKTMEVEVTRLRQWADWRARTASASARKINTKGLGRRGPQLSKRKG